MYTFETTLGGRSFTVEAGKMAKQANGAVLVRYGDTVVLVTATASAEPREGVDFFPLTVDYEEKCIPSAKFRADLSNVKAVRPNRLFYAAA